MIQTTVRPNVPLVLIGHGSPDEQARREAAALIELLRREARTPVYCGYLEFQQPDARSAIAQAAASGAAELSVVSLVLLPGAHWSRDVPRLLAEVACDFPQLRFRYAQPLVQQAELQELARVRVRDALAAGAQWRPHEGELWVVARGSRRREVDRALAQLAEHLAADFGFAGYGRAYVSVAEPTLEQVLPCLLARRAVILPLLAFGGVLVKRIERMVCSVPGNADRLLLARHLGPHPLLAAAIMRAAVSAPLLSR